MPNFYRILSQPDVEAVHNATISILEHTGIAVNHTEGLKLLEAAGVQVDKQSQRVKIPERLVERCLATAPEKIVLAGRNPQKDLLVEHGRLPVARNGGGSDYTLDLDTNERRPLHCEDLKNYVRLMDGLEHIDFIAPVYAHDFPIPTRDIRVLETLFHNTDKHVHMRAYSKNSLKVMLEMAVAVAGSEASLKKRPILSLLEAPISPLIFPAVSVDALFLCGQYGIPLEWCCMPIAGGTGPMTLAGNVVLANAEFLGGLVISQLANPGAPFEYAPRCMIMDMKRQWATGSIEGA
jgi:trimethylamine--corrinoid protein Co-methyltransferase